MNYILLSEKEVRMTYRRLFLNEQSDEYRKWKKCLQKVDPKKRVLWVVQVS